MSAGKSVAGAAAITLLILGAAAFVAAAWLGEGTSMWLSLLAGILVAISVAALTLDKRRRSSEASRESHP